MFWGCESFNSDISSWNVSKVTDMCDMFLGCDSFKYDLSSWNISKADYTISVRKHMRHINEEFIPKKKSSSISKLDPYSCHP